MNRPLCDQAACGKYATWRYEGAEACDYDLGSLLHRDGVLTTEVERITDDPRPKKVELISEFDRSSVAIVVDGVEVAVLQVVA